MNLGSHTGILTVKVKVNRPYGAQAKSEFHVEWYDKQNTNCQFTNGRHKKP